VTLTYMIGDNVLGTYLIVEQKLANQLAHIGGTLIIGQAMQRQMAIQ